MDDEEPARRARSPLAVLRRRRAADPADFRLLAVFALFGTALAAHLVFGENPWTGKNKDMPGARLARMAEERGLVKPAGGGADNPMLAEQKRTNELLAQQNVKLDQLGDFAGTDFMPIAAQRKATRSFARRIR